MDVVEEFLQLAKEYESKHIQIHINDRDLTIITSAKRRCRFRDKTFMVVAWNGWIEKAFTPEEFLKTEYCTLYFMMNLKKDLIKCL